MGEFEVIWVLLRDLNFMRVRGEERPVVVDILWWLRERGM